MQHAWATAVEVVCVVTENQPKFQTGDMKFIEAMDLAGEILARAYEGMKLCYPNLDNIALVDRFVKLDKNIGLTNMLRVLNATDGSLSSKKNFILMMSDSNVEVKAYRGATDALKALFIMEKESPGKDIVFVRADTTDSVRIAFKNYFNDATEFIRLFEDGCVALCNLDTNAGTQQVNN